MKLVSINLKLGTHKNTIIYLSILLLFIIITL